MIDSCVYIASAVETERPGYTQVYIHGITRTCTVRPVVHCFEYDSNQS